MKLENFVRSVNMLPRFLKQSEIDYLLKRLNRKKSLLKTEKKKSKVKRIQKEAFDLAYEIKTLKEAPILKYQIDLLNALSLEDPSRI